MAQPYQVWDQYQIGYVMEMSWHHVFGEPWVMAEQAFSRIFPREDPHSTEKPSPSISKSHTHTPAVTESQLPFNYKSISVAARANATTSRAPQASRNR